LFIYRSSYGFNGWVLAKELNIRDYYEMRIIYKEKVFSWIGMLFRKQTAFIGIQKEMTF
jgi:hypothetical protein